MFEKRVGGLSRGRQISFWSFYNQRSSVAVVVVVAIVWHSASEEDLAIVDCFLDDQEIALGPI